MRTLHFMKVSSALLKGSVEEDQALLQSVAVGNGGGSGTVAAVVKSLAYLRDRVCDYVDNVPFHRSSDGKITRGSIRKTTQSDFLILYQW